MTPLPELNRLIDDVAGEAGSDDPLERLAAAGRARQQLDELTEALLDHFVEEARQAGCSWSQIGGAIGVSKQAAQQRHMASESVTRRFLGRVARQWRADLGMFTRFTAEARQSVVDAQAAARRLGDDHVDTEHLLLGVLAQPESTGARALTELGLTAAEAETAVAAGAGPAQDPGMGPVKGHIPFTPRAKKVLELALRHGLKLGHKHLGTEHIVLGLIHDGQGKAAAILAGRGIDFDGVRAVVVRLVAEDG